MCSLFSTNSMFTSKSNVLIILLLVSWLGRKKYVPDVRCFNLLHNTVKSLVVFIVNTSYSCKQMASMNPTCILGFCFFLHGFIRSWKQRNAHTQICIYLMRHKLAPVTIVPRLAEARYLPPAFSTSGAPTPLHQTMLKKALVLSLSFTGAVTFPRDPPELITWPQINWWPRVRHWPRVRCWQWQTRFLIVYWCGIKHSQLCNSHWGHSQLQFSSHRELSTTGEKYADITVVF